MDKEVAEEASAAPKRSDYVAISESDVAARSIELELNHVHRVYDVIASHFSSTRYKGWPKVVEFVKDVTTRNPGSIVIDVGCGNGKYCQSIAEGAYWIGSDYCLNLLRDAQLKKAKAAETFRGDILRLAVKSNSADATIAIAVLHHITTRERRVQAISELMRVTRPGGRVLIYTMAREQTPGSIGAREFGQLTNIYLPWKMRNENGLTEMLRFCHLSDPQELKGICHEVLCKNSARGDRLESLYYDSNNWAVILNKGSGHHDNRNNTDL